MALNDTERIAIPQADDETPRNADTIRAVALVGVAALTGDPATIAAAEPIREARLIAADDVLTELRSNAILTDEQVDTAITAPQQVLHSQVQAAQAALNRLRHQTEADWWVAHQHQSAWEMLNSFLISE